MPHTKKPSTSTDFDIPPALALLDQLEAQIDYEVLNPDYPSDLLDQELRTLGHDPEAVGEVGAALAADLTRKRRLAWQNDARNAQRNAEPFLQQLAGGSSNALRRCADAMSHDELLAFIQTTRETTPTIQLEFRNRAPEALSTGELRELAIKLQTLSDRVDHNKK